MIVDWGFDPQAASVFHSIIALRGAGRSSHFIGLREKRATKRVLLPLQRLQAEVYPPALAALMLSRRQGLKRLFAHRANVCDYTPTMAGLLRARCFSGRILWAKWIE